MPTRTPKMNAAIGVAVPRFWKFEVTGLFETGMFQYDNQFVYVPFDELQELLPTEPYSAAASW